MYNIKGLRIKTKSSYSLEDRGTDGMESILECTLKDLSNDIWHAYQSWKLVGDEENNVPPPLHRRGGVIKYIVSNHVDK